MSENRENFNEKLEEYKELTEKSKPELGMSWFKFLIYFALFFNALDNLVSGVALIFDIRHELLDTEYYFDGNMRWLGILFGFIWITAAAAFIYIRFELAEFKSGAPKKYIIIEIIDSIVYLLFNLAGILLAGESDTLGIIGSVIVAVVGSARGAFAYIYLNVIYFRKRKHLFVN